MTRFHAVEGRFEAFLRKPLSARKAMGVIVTATIVSVAIGGMVINLVDAEEFPNVGIGLWWALQTVTTVGYGDVTPQNGYLAGSSTAAANRLLSTVAGAAACWPRCSYRSPNRRSGR